MEDKRIGKFYVDYDDVLSGKAWLVLARMSFVPLRVEMLAHKRQFEYIGLSPLFDNCKAGVIPPIYNVTVNDLGHDTSHDVSVSVSKEE